MYEKENAKPLANATITRKGAYNTSDMIQNRGSKTALAVQLKSKEKGSEFLIICLKNINNNACFTY